MTTPNELLVEIQALQLLLAQIAKEVAALSEWWDEPEGFINQTGEQPMKIIYTEWLSASYEAGPVCAENATGRVALRTVGFLVRETEEELILAPEAQDYGDEGDKFRYVITIPKTDITKRCETTLAGVGFIPDGLPPENEFELF